MVRYLSFLVLLIGSWLFDYLPFAIVAAIVGVTFFWAE